MSYRRFLFGSVALGGLMASGIALAQDAAVGHSWNGAFIGADVGLGVGSTLRERNTGIFLAEDGSLGGEALTGGVYAGYDYEVAPGLVFGIEAGLDFFNSEASSGPSTIDDTYEFRSLGAAYAGARGGIEISPRTLLYGRLAYAAIHAESTEALSFAPHKQEFLNGYQVAAGLETEVTDGVTVRVEGTYTKALESLVSGDAGEYEHTPSHFGASAGVTYRFGADSRSPRVDLEPNRSWLGGYIGVLAGGIAATTVDGGLEGAGAVGPTPVGPASSISGEYGLYAGVNVPIGDQWVVGVEGELTKYDAVFDALEVDDLYDYASSDIKGQASLRFGYLVNPDTLLYARGGYGAMRVNPDPLNAPTGEPAYIPTVSAGLGVETLISPHALFRVEGLYNAALEEYRFSDSLDPADPKPFFVQPNSVEARVGAAFMF